MHPPTCPCGGSGFEKSSTDNPLKIPIPCTPTNKELIEKFRNRFGNYGLYENQGYMGYKDVMPEVEAFLLAQAQELNEKHEADIRDLFHAIEGNKFHGEIHDGRMRKMNDYVMQEKGGGLTEFADYGIQLALDAFATKYGELCLSQLRSNDKE